MKSGFFYVLIGGLYLASSCGPNVPKQQHSHRGETDLIVFQGMSLMGDSLNTTIDSASQGRQFAEVQAAEDTYENDPSLENLIWVGRREAYLGRYDLAIRTFSKAIREFPEAYEPLRHRGHRYISIREFDRAILDLLKASELMEGSPLQIEADGIPNKLNIPLSNVQFNVWYHLGLAYYLNNDWEKALDAYQSCLEVSDNDDLKVATLDWYYMTLLKLGRKEEALIAISKIREDAEIIENDAYHKRILLYQGNLSPETLLASDNEDALHYVTQGYGLGNYYLSLGDTTKAVQIFQKVLDTRYWSAFGYIASEMELAKLVND
jgi:tetratricopeptide (TPR) repeat protein